jgi:uncharacterized secreted protein with C-terminal beta-propeller domain
MGVAAAILVVLGTVSAAIALNGGDGGEDGDDGAAPPRTSTSTTTTSTSTPGNVQATAAGDAVVLKKFDDCPSVLDAARKQALADVTAYGIQYPGYAQYKNFEGDMAAPAAATGEARAADSAATSAGSSTGGGGTSSPEFSGTNVQEAGVDEPDIVKNDGHAAFALINRQLRATVIGDGGSLQRGDALDLDIQPGAELLKIGDDIAVLSPNAEFGTRIIVVDAHDPQALEVMRQVDVEGHYLSARQIGDTIRLVVTQNGPAFDFVYPQSNSPVDTASALAHNRAAVRSATLAEWLPDVTIDSRTKLIPAPACDDIYLTPSFAGPGSTSVITFSASEGKVLDATSVMATATEVYSTTERLYVATSAWAKAGADTTEIHEFDVSDPGHSKYVASGSVPGHLLRPSEFAMNATIGQWSMSEQDGDLRVATTNATTNDNAVTVLRPSAGVLAPIGTLTGIAPDEQLYAVRFIGDTGYVVTYRTIDPLFVLDLSDPTHPRKVGELKLPGYSAYLHPLGDGLLLGIGQQDPNEDGVTDGTQASLFDVSDPAHPKKLGEIKLGDRFTVTGVEQDPRSFTWWTKPRRAVITMANWGSERPFSGAIALDPERSGITEVGRMTYSGQGGGCGMSPALRTRVIGDQLLLFSPDGVQSASLDDLSPRASLAYGTTSSNSQPCRYTEAPMATD